MENNDLLKRVYSVTNAGLDVIRDILGDVVDDGVINHKKAFRLRPEERTPSAHLYPPRDSGDCWHVKDFGMGEGGGYFSPIDLYMWSNGTDQFRMALEQLAERYGVEERLSVSVNKPDIEQRAARPEEMGAGPRVTLFGGVGGLDLSCWGNGVKPEHLTTYGWQGVSEVAITYGDKVMVRRPTATYPIFAQKCDYTDAQGQLLTFYKVYEPLNPDKAHRFLICGQKPRQHDYIYGLDAVRRKFREQGEEKLPVLLLVSGGSDAVCALSNGYLSVWLDSEVKGLTEDGYKVLLKYTQRVVNIPDIDVTGKKAGTLLAIRIPSISTAWLNESDMGGLHDNRGRQCKDLRDYCRLHPGKKAMDQLVYRAVKAKFWSEKNNQQGEKEYALSRTSLDYFLELNGFFKLKDESRNEPSYIRIEGIKVARVNANTIVDFLKGWMMQQALPKPLIDKVLRSHDLPTSNASTIRTRNDLDFSKATATAQYFHFRNCWVEVTAEKIITHRYTDASDHYVWEDSIIPHDYRPMPDMFNVSTTEDGQYEVVLNTEMQLSNFLMFIANTCRLYWRKQMEGGLELSCEEIAEQNLALASRLANLGYLLYSHKSESEAWATLCMDSTLAESADECNGRSGKSFYLKAIAKMVKTFPIDASKTSFRDPRFLFDGVTADTSLVFIDECPLKFNYNFVFGLITGDMRVEEKNRHSFVIPFAQSPKLGLATNFTLSRHDPSTEGRFWPQPFSDYYHVKTPKNDYNETRTIRDDFGQNLMGTEYSEDDWQRDLAFMVQAVRFYLSLKSGERRIMPPLNRIERREQMAAVGKDFKQWADDYFAEGSGHLDCELKAEQVLADFNRETLFGWAPKKMTQHLKDYCLLADHIHCLNPVSITHQKKDGDRWIQRDANGVQKTYYYVQTRQAFDDTRDEQPVQTEMPF